MPPAFQVALQVRPLEQQEVEGFAEVSFDVPEVHPGGGEAVLLQGPVLVGRAVALLEKPEGESTRFGSRRSGRCRFQGLAAGKKVEGHVSALGRGQQLPVFDADERAIDGAPHCVGFAPVPGLQGVAVLAVLVAEEEMEPAVSFLERGHCKPPAVALMLAKCLQTLYGQKRKDLRHST